jgi:hypothetical protein
VIDIDTRPSGKESGNTGNFKEISEISEISVISVIDNNSDRYRY